MVKKSSPIFISDDELLTPEEAVRSLKLPSKNWIYQHVHAGTLPFPHCKIGHYLRFPASGIQAYIAAQTREAGE
jgi:predicted DNA-binding transcriptional regulator AlpA